MCGLPRPGQGSRAACAVMVAVMTLVTVGARWCRLPQPLVRFTVFFFLYIYILTLLSGTQRPAHCASRSPLRSALVPLPGTPPSSPRSIKWTARPLGTYRGARDRRHQEARGAFVPVPQWRFMWHVPPHPAARGADAGLGSYSCCTRNSKINTQNFLLSQKKQWRHRGKKQKFKPPYLPKSCTPRAANRFPGRLGGP